MMGDEKANGSGLLYGANQWWRRSFHDDTATGKALRFSAAAGLPSASPDPSDTENDRCSLNGALRHQLWQAKMTIEDGSRSAENIGDAHEFGAKVTLKTISKLNSEEALKVFQKGNVVFDTTPEADRMVDQLNNIAGRKHGEAFKQKNSNASDKELALYVLDKMFEEGCYTAHRTADGKYRVEHQKLPQALYDSAKRNLEKTNEAGYLPDHPHFQRTTPILGKIEVQKHQAEIAQAKQASDAFFKKIEPVSSPQQSWAITLRTTMNQALLTKSVGEVAARRIGDFQNNSFDLPIGDKSLKISREPLEAVKILNQKNAVLANAVTSEYLKQHPNASNKDIALNVLEHAHRHGMYVTKVDAVSVIFSDGVKYRIEQEKLPEKTYQAAKTYLQSLNEQGLPTKSSSLTPSAQGVDATQQAQANSPAAKVDPTNLLLTMIEQDPSLRSGASVGAKTLA